MSNFIKFKYRPGIYPMPMIMIRNEVNFNAFNEKYKNEKGKWDESGNHYFTIGSYIIEKNEEVISYKYNDFSNLVWLLRFMNKAVNILISEKELMIINEYYQNEFQK